MDGRKGPKDGSVWIDSETDQHAWRRLRGGSWISSPRNCRSAYRRSNYPDFAYNGVGFRVCCLPQSYFLYP